LGSDAQLLGAIQLALMTANSPSKVDPESQKALFL